ncbi:serine/threonine protein phosphatase [Kitasatospora sp. MMS16-BH015]|uniref:PP2C family protein-serine/threonine phosphatase n=1 Tax=Kitasatospora sp. MMS16-BH015 TaxID=2018025 RepID=UPI000CA2C3A1|nr:PP2C family protein-serine/threonine phosphatase [Kitasatospora sp. MMS16-BH015]AUG75316.1 serine/threonine protein phosphatase [Kitasatospora sp. MMS16-BH015]
MTFPQTETSIAPGETEPSFLAAAPYPVLVLATDGTVRDASDAAWELLGRPAGRDAAAVPWLLEAHLRLLATASGRADGAAPAATVHGRVAGGEVEAHPSVRPDGSVVWWLVDRADHRLTAEQDRWELLAELSGLLLSSLNVDRCLETTAQQAAAHLADAAVVVSPTGGRVLRFVSCVRGGRPQHGRARVDPADVPGLAEALRGFPPVPSRWIDPATAPDWLRPEGMTAVGAVSVTPLPGHGVPAGALVLLRGPGEGAFTQAEEVFARLFAARAGAAVSAAVMYSEQAAVTDLLMRDLLPPRLEHLDGADFAGGYRASEDRARIGGDFYDVHPAADPGGETLAVLGDVCGKGLEAAVLTGKIRNTLHALLPLADDHPRLLAMLNRALLTSHHTRFATMVLASVRRRSDRVTVRLSAAGHPAPLIVRADGRVEASPTCGSLVGVLPETTVESDTVELAPGEACVLYSDGVTEARGGPLGEAMFGEERLRRELGQCARMPAEAIVERVLMLASQWVGGGRHDDMAVLVVAAPQEGRLTPSDGHRAAVTGPQGCAA